MHARTKETRSNPIYRGPLPHISTIERVPVTVYDDSGDANRAIAREIAALIRTRSGKNQKTVLGLATGSTPVGIYDELIRLHTEEQLSFKQVITFNLDEYWWSQMPCRAITGSCGNTCLTILILSQRIFTSKWTTWP